MLAAEPPKITVSKETTYITKPLTEDGLPDYRRAWLERLRKRKVPASENGAVDYWQTVGLAMVDEKYRQAFCDELGMPTPPEEAVLETVGGDKTTRAIAIWYLQQTGVDVDEENFAQYEAAHPNAALAAQLWPDDLETFVATNRSFAAHQVPPLVEWKTRNTAKLDRIVAAMEQPNWYAPPPSLCVAVDEDATMMGLGTMDQRSVANCLAMRAQIALGQGDLTLAVRDLVAIHRLSNIQPPDLYLDLVLFNAARILSAAPVELQLVSRSDATDRQLSQLQQLHALDVPPSRLPGVLRAGERLYGLNYSLALLQRHDEVLQTLGYFCDDPAAVQRTRDLLELPLDANRFLRGVNRDFEKQIAIAEKSNVRQRLAEIESMNKDLSDELVATTPLQELSLQQRADALLELLWLIQGSSFDTMIQGEARHATHDQLMHLAMALGRYRLANGEYPESLEAVVPRYAARIPVDAYGNESFGYRKTDNGFLLYSYGLNGVDDRGSHNDMNILSGYTAAAYSDQVRELLGNEVPGPGLLEGYVPVRADDIAIRLPLIEVSLPGHGE